ncbi:peptidase M23 [Bradyrhizobium sp. WBOS7]|uniref:Peptidase M23 n=1 Tax=Bradyrhizobium betae TaxID=244734 RepID=A0AAE9NDW0_9BRAD|nr:MULTISPECIES: M23 family peptidase [Bradyrhizobium]MDD1572256.1 peptidase M23 [Bradyrhizobium sp. WBOS1]UUO36951.1 peptidase M23 [Bradyrhizobium sp. WBOS01]MDD1529117.1 peptidase M23 [Bradyrhizobium sp. WBOS2]MDD1578106.1 peptidase M23 [Bradyrhizobium sp. WBOS7]MDD1601516.1 peptidase M23 [Bradyrhizobium sp. WBOS16]
MAPGGGTVVGKGFRFVSQLLASLSLFSASALAADEFRSPSLTALRVDWRAALDQFRTEINSRPRVAEDFVFAPRRSVPRYDPRATPALVQLNAVSSRFFIGITRSPVPVLLPFDAAAYLEGQRGGAPATLALSRYQADFNPVDMFDAGPAGYSATFSFEPGAGEGMPARVFARPVEVQITGSALVYDIADPSGGKGEQVKPLATLYPDLRRFIREGYVRYAFTRFGVAYVVSIQCLDSVAKPRRLACKEAYPVAERFLKALRVAGGQRARPLTDIASIVVDRPAARSPDFSYRPSGDIIPNTGYRKQGGHPDVMAYAQIRFPLEKAPAFVRSQSYGKREKSEGPTAYYWRDNFCESRSFEVWQCGGGYGHQGEDIRAADCPPAGERREPCDPKQHAVVAVRDAIVIRAAKDQAVTLQVNSRTEHIRFRYMHMNPNAMNADGVLNGRSVTEGEKIGVISNYLDRPAGTSLHLHFDVQVFTRDGWIWVSPYVTLVSAYERLIRARGREVGPEIAVTAQPVAHALPDDVLKPDLREGSSGEDN